MMTRGSWWCAALAACVVQLVSSTTQAQVQPRPVHTTQLFNSWTFEPILINGEVKAFVAHADPASLVGDNIPILWYEKNTDGSWTTWGWSVYDLGSTVSWLRDHYGSPDLLAASPALSQSVTPNTLMVAPKNMTEGLYSDDPMHQLVSAAEDPVAIVSLLEVIGWEAAPTLSSMAVLTVDTCIESSTVTAIEQMLNESANKMELVLTGTSVTPVDCFSSCTGCLFNFDAAVPDAGSSWTLTETIYPSGLPNTQLCYWERPGMQRQWQSGQTTACGACTDVRTVAVTMKTKTSVPRGDECVAP